MKKGLLSFSCVCMSIITALPASAQQKQEVVFKGKADAKYNGERVLLYNNSTGDKDTGVIANGKFEIRVPYTKPTRFMFSSSVESRLRGGYVPFGIVVDGPGVVNISADMPDLYKSKVTNAPANEAIVYFSKRSAELDKITEDKIDRLHGKGALRSRENMKQPWYKEASRVFDSARFVHGNQAMEEMVKKYPHSLSAAYVMSVYSGSMAADKQEALYESFTDKLKQSAYGVATKQLIEGRRYSAIGKTIKDFTMKNELGKDIDIAIFRGKYVLIDFWASWCMPCLASFPKLQEVYAQYKTKGFEIVGISTDKSESAWLNAVKTTGNTWPQLHDTDDIASKFFAVKALPTTFLIDPSGKIIARNVHADELEAKLKEILPAQ